MLGCIRKIYKYRKKMLEEINILQEEMIKLREDNISIKMLISSQHNAINNPFFYKRWTYIWRNKW